MEKAVILPEKKNNYRHKTPAHQQFANSFFFFFLCPLLLLLFSSVRMRLAEWLLFL